MSQNIDLTSLKARFRGSLLTGADGDRYQLAKALFNAMYDTRQPVVIAQVTGAADILAALEFARAGKLPIAVRGGGHSVAGHGSADGGLVIDLSGMKGIRVDLQPGGRAPRRA
jgi:FAD/FMN-containing dehydrogenase